MKKALKIIIATFSVIFFIILSSILYFFCVTSPYNLDKNKLVNVDRSMVFYDSQNNEILEQSNGISITEFESIPKHTINAFIAIEDKRFYKHNGIDYKGIMRALFNNIKSFKAKQGASTINQQLIKNTHLSNEKTIKRKLVELKLARKLDKTYSKNEILEKYLNTIYFGNSCYGITSACKFYFNKSPKDLTVNESAILAGIIKAPTLYSPIDQASKCNKRKNTVLKEMLNQEYISLDEYDNAIKQSVENTIKIKDKCQYDFLYKAQKELADILEENPYKYDKTKIKTTLNSNFQEILKSTIEQQNNEYKFSGIILDKNAQILSYYSNCEEDYRQMGSTVKPILVYAPAIDTNTVFSCTKLNDEKTDFNGYSPSNYNDKYYGKISVKDSLTKSSNVCAVKLLSLTGVEKCVKYLNKTDIKLTNNDNSLALALGASEMGATLSQLASAYCPFINEGEYNKPSTIDKSNKNNKEKLFINNVNSVKIYNNDTCQIITDMLKKTVTDGTAKKLLYSNVPLCAKTGTVGNSKGNTDAYCVSYNKDYVLALWVGNKENHLLPNKVTGGTLPTIISSEIWQKIYLNESAPNFDNLDQTVNLNIDKISYDENDVVELADKNSPKKYIKSEIFKKSYFPKATSKRFSIPICENSKLSVNNNEIDIRLCLTEYTNIKIFRECNGVKELVFDSIDKKTKDSFIDKNLKKNFIYTYSIIPYFNFNKKEILGKEVTIGTVKIEGVIDQWWQNDFE